MELAEYMIAKPCNECGGRRLKPESLAVTIDERNIGELVEMSIAESLRFFERASGSRRTGSPVSIPRLPDRFSRKSASGCGSS